MTFTPQQLDRVTALRMKYAEQVGRECDLGVDSIVALIDKSPKANDDKIIADMQKQEGTTGETQGSTSEAASKTTTE